MHPKLTPPLKWAGGKRWLVPTLQGIFQHFTDVRLVEPFVGGMSVALGLAPEKALLNDANAHLINFYKHIQNGLNFELPYANDETAYYQAREAFNTLIADGKHESEDAAMLFYYLMRTGFNGLCRFNRSGFYNVPFGRYKTINYRKDFSAYQQKLQGFAFSCGDFTDLALSENDFLYLDPPYDVEFTQYSSNDFKWQDQLRLLSWLENIDIPIVISNQATPRIIKEYKRSKFKLFHLDAPRMISCNGDRTKAAEVLAVKNMPRKVMIKLNTELKKL